MDPIELNETHWVRDVVFFKPIRMFEMGTSKGKSLMRKDCPPFFYGLRPTLKTNQPKLQLTHSPSDPPQVEDGVPTDWPSPCRG
jgi:hypothetical protein